MTRAVSERSLPGFNAATHSLRLAALLCPELGIATFAEARREPAMSDQYRSDQYRNGNSNGTSNSTSGATSDATWRSGGGFDARPHAYDPYTQPELFRGVLIRRMVAFLIDLIVLAIPVALALIFIAVFGIVTLGLGWMLFWLVSPFSIVWAVVYYGTSLGGPYSATLGMRAMDLQLRTWYGAPAYFVLGAVHAVLFYVLISALTPLVLLVGLLNGRKRLLHDIILGTVMVNSSVRAGAFQSVRPV